MFDNGNRSIVPTPETAEWLQFLSIILGLEFKVYNLYTTVQIKSKHATKHGIRSQC